MPRKKADKTESSEPKPKIARAKKTGEPKADASSRLVKKTPAKAKAVPKTPLAKGTKKLKAVGSKPSPLLKKTTRITLKSASSLKGPRSWELPTRYGETKAVLLARDPYWIYAYWEITADKLQSAKSFLGEEHARSSSVLRVYQSGGPGGGEPLFLYDVEVRPYVTSWYLNVHHPDHDYYVEIVQRSPSGKIFLLVRSNVVKTPRDFVTPTPDQKWSVPDAIAKYFRQETRVQQTGISSAGMVEGSSFERYPSGKGL